MGANNLYFPSTSRTYSFTKESFMVIDDKKTGHPLKINVLDFFSQAAALGLVPPITGLPLIFESSPFNIVAGVPYTITIPSATGIIDVSLYDVNEEDISTFPSTDTTTNQVIFEANVDKASVTAKIIYKTV